MQISAPRIGPFEINLNTVVVLVGFVSGFVAWGYTLSDMQAGRIQNKANIDRLDVRLATVETEVRRIDNHELRLATMEKAAADASDTMKSLDRTLNALASDIRVTKEILLRLEAAQPGHNFQPKQ